MNLNLDTRLRRREAAKALTEAGFPTAEATLASKATRGGGPPFEKYGPFAIYTWATTLAWARSRSSKPVTCTAELEAA